MPARPTLALRRDAHGMSHGTSPSPRFHKTTTHPRATDTAFPDDGGRSFPPSSIWPTSSGSEASPLLSSSRACGRTLPDGTRPWPHKGLQHDVRRPTSSDDRVRRKPLPASEQICGGMGTASKKVSDHDRASGMKPPHRETDGRSLRVDAACACTFHENGRIAGPLRRSPNRVFPPSARKGAAPKALPAPVGRRGSSRQGPATPVLTEKTLACTR
jgi:hypothetical protein